jgi:hypothetical protein
MSNRLCIDLFSGTGGFSSAFEKSRQWDVIEVDKRDDHPDINPTMVADVMKMDASAFPLDEYENLVVVASPPCKAFSLAASHIHMDADVSPLTDFGGESVAMVKKTISLIEDLQPDYWFLENPRAGLRRVMREKFWGLGEPTGTISWCQYGANRMKPTDLWGEHPEMEYRFCAKGEDCHTSAPRGSPTGTQGVDTSLRRAAIPYSISLSILEAVERAIV